MIIRETKDHFVMIEQDKHAILSEEIMSYWKERISKVTSIPKSVLTAIKLHDYGWKYFDKQPLWDDQKNAPYDFSDFPLAPKTVIYTHGITEVEHVDKYAALLCSKHFTHFLLQEASPYATQFVNQERKRQKRIKHELDHFDNNLFHYHYELLRFADSLSLFLCINEPNATKEEFHHFFRNGIKLPSTNIKLLPEWVEKQTVLLQPFPFQSQVKLQIEQKVIAKEEIKKSGMVKSYEDTPYETIKFVLAPK